MKTINALTIRNNLGKVLQELEETREPVLVSKGRKVRAALITIEDFQTRFIDKQAEVDSLTSLEALRNLRGYRQ